MQYVQLKQRKYAMNLPFVGQA